MSYLKHVLQPGETVRYRGSLHWILLPSRLAVGHSGSGHNHRIVIDRETRHVVDCRSDHIVCGAPDDFTSVV